MNNDCLVTVDGTDFRIAENGRTFYSHKFKKSGLRYEVAISIISGDIVWINGPFECGKWPDIKIMRASLCSELQPGERVEADDGYIGEAPAKVKCPRSFTNKQSTEKMQARARNRQETVNARFKTWQILRQIFRHNIIKHGEVFATIAIITQLSIDHGEKLFQVIYKDD